MVTWIAVGAATVMGGGTMAYPQARDGVRLMYQDAISAYDWVRARFTGASSAQASASNKPDLQATSSTTMWVLGPHMSGVQTLFTAAGIVVELYKAYQGDQIAKELKGISEAIVVSNNIQAQRSDDPNGFAQSVRDFVDLKVEQYTKDGGSHRFFVYHPDTQWHDPFSGLLRDEGPLHESFCGISNDLFAICRWMLCMRVELQEKGMDKDDRFHFHVLIPEYQTIVIPRAFVLLPALFPLTFDGEIANNQRLVWLNMPGEGLDTLKDVGNLHVPREQTWQSVAVISILFGGFLAGAGAAVALAIVVAASLGPSVVGPVFYGSGLSFGVASYQVAKLVEDMWREAPPALLG